MPTKANELLTVGEHIYSEN